MGTAAATTFEIWDILPNLRGIFGDIGGGDKDSVDVFEDDLFLGSDGVVGVA